MRFEGKVAFITGAARGMGMTHALGFAKEGADIVALDIAQDIPGMMYTGPRNSDLDGVIDEVRKLGRKAIGIIADVRNSTEVKSAVDRAVAELGKIDILVNNAGICVAHPLVNHPDEEIDAIIDINVKGTMYCCKHIIPHMARQKDGKIVNISSFTGLSGFPMMPVYSASKFAVIGLTEALAGELAYYNINVNAVCPGGIRTPLFEGQARTLFPDKDVDQGCNQMNGVHFFQRSISMEEITAAVLYLASEDARNITGIALPVSAGAELKTPPPVPFFSI